MVTKTSSGSNPETKRRDCCGKPRHSRSGCRRNILNMAMDHIIRLRRLAGLREARQVSDPDEEDHLDDARRVREANIVRHIEFAFQKIGLAIAEDGVFYQEDSDREVLVTLDDSQIDLDLLAALKTTGLAESYKVWGSRGALIIMFEVSPALDNVV